MKKLIALTLAGAMVFSLPVLAAASPTALDVAAASESKTVNEYLNNIVERVHGLENVTPVGQGGHVIINGAPSNQTFTVAKPSAEAVDTAKVQADVLGGTILNVVNIKASVSDFETARVNFYVKGVEEGQNIKVYYLVDGQWTELTVAEIRVDHVVVDMTGLGTLLFVEVPTVF